MPRPSVPADQPALTRMISWWFRVPATGEIVLWQAPNATILVVQAASALQLLNVLPERRNELGRVRLAALVLWSLDELVRGTTPFRRLLGAGVLAWQVGRRLR